jgi:L-alanine-DL-glutamate epimerase-like enolase superfamily enzyme
MIFDSVRAELRRALARKGNEMADSDLLHPGRVVGGADIRWLKLPLHTPYRLSYRTFMQFEPFIVAVRDTEGRVGWGEGHVSPGSSKETRDGGWAFCAEQVRRLPGLTVAEARALLLAAAPASPVAASAMVTALEMLGEHRALQAPQTVRHALLAPFEASTPDAIAAEVERRLAEGFTTLKVKVGKDVAADLARVQEIQRAARGRVTLRLDANRAFSRADAIAFVTSVDPAGIALFEQPCPTEAWDDNAAVAAASNVPVMLDEPICSLADIARAGAIPGVKFCKIKLKRFVGVGRLVEALEAIRAHGMGAVLGDGLGADISAWMEAMAGAGRIHAPGEFNGFLKLQESLLATPLPVDGAAMTVPAGFVPVPDTQALAAHTLAHLQA